jgi:hypothetical protein
MEGKENNTYCVSATPLFIDIFPRRRNNMATPLFIDIFPCIRNNTYLCIDTKLSTIVGHWNKLRIACYQEGENFEIMHMFAASGAYIQMPPWPPTFTIMERQDCDAALKMTLSR